MFLFCIATCGCNRGPDTAVVKGVVRLDGKPLTYGTVRFTPKAGRSATGFIESDGSFTLGTFTKTDGAIVGLSRVAVATFKHSGPPNYDSDRPVRTSEVPMFYTSPDSSGLTFDVKPGIENHAEFDLTSASK
jgi:hypothetical protein